MPLENIYSVGRIAGVEVYGLSFDDGREIQFLDSESPCFRPKGERVHLDDVAKRQVLEELRTAELDGERERGQVSIILSRFNGSQSSQRKGKKQRVRPRSNGNGEYADIRDAFNHEFRGSRFSREQRDVLSHYGLSVRKKGNFLVVCEGNKVYTRIPLSENPRSGGKHRSVRNDIIRGLRQRAHQ